MKAKKAPSWIYTTWFQRTFLFVSSLLNTISRACWKFNRTSSLFLGISTLKERIKPTLKRQNGHKPFNGLAAGGQQPNARGQFWNAGMLPALYGGIADKPFAIAWSLLLLACRLPAGRAINEGLLRNNSISGGKSSRGSLLDINTNTGEFGGSCSYPVSAKQAIALNLAGSTNTLNPSVQCPSPMHPGCGETFSTLGDGL